MLSRLSHPGIIIDNIRGLSFSLTATSLVGPVLGAEALVMALGIMIGSYYGYRIEKETHELRSLGGRILKGRSWDYLVLA
jgi:hypothetical protein